MEMTLTEIASVVHGTLIGGNCNQVIHGFSTNSKEGDEHTLFVPIIGERVDAHDFISDAYRNGMRATFSSRDCTVDEKLTDMAYIYVEDTINALQVLGAWYREQFHIPVIGITGSVGKTTTKEMIAAALETELRVLKTAGNKNGQIGLPQMMCQLTKEHDIAVIEMGMSLEGEMERLTPIAKPETVVLTNIGVSHIGQLKTKENIRKEKLNIINAFKSDSTLFLNGDDPLLNEMYKVYGNNTNRNDGMKQIQTLVAVSDCTRDKLEIADIVTFGLSSDSNIYASHIKTVGEETHFIFHANFKGKDGIVENYEEEIVLHVLGNHNVSNALAALAVALKYGIKPSVAKVGLENYRPISMRGSIKNVDGITVIDDTYNASPDSMKSAIDVLCTVVGVKRRIAVLADILELGEHSKECHREVGTYIVDKTVDEVYTMGTEARFIGDAIYEGNKAIKVSHFNGKDLLIEALKKELKSGDAIVFKGSRGMKLDLVVHELFEK